MSDVQWSDRYSGQAVFSDLTVNNRSFEIKEGSYMPHDGSYRPVPGSGDYITDGGLSVKATLYVMKGTDPFPYILKYP